MSSIKVNLIQERADFSQYLILPTKYNFKKLVGIYANVLKYLDLKKIKLGGSPEFKFSVFTVHSWRMEIPTSTQKPRTKLLVVQMKVYNMKATLAKHLLTCIPQQQEKC